MFTRNKFGWSPTLYGIFANYKTVLQLAGTVAGVYIMSKKLHFHDCIIAIIGLCLNILCATFNMVAVTTWQVFLIPLTDSLFGGTLSAQKSVVTKLIPRDELGKIISLTGAMDCIMPIAIAPIYTVTYQNTLHVMPEAYFLVQMGFALIGIVLFGVLYALDRIDGKNIKKYAKPTENGASMQL